jgi:uncharacterized phage-associated protein
MGIASRQDVISYLLVRLKCLNRMQLMKLPYLADVEHMKRYGRPLSESSYIRDKLGAVDYMILDTAEVMPAVSVESVTTIFGSRGKNYRATDSLADSADRIGVQACAVLDAVIEEHGRRGGDHLGKLTKKTLPWKDAVERDSRVLRLSVVAPEDKLAHLRSVRKRVDRSTIGTPEDLARRDTLVDQRMEGFRLRAMGE